MYSIRDFDKWSDELKEAVAVILGGHIPGKPIKEEETNEQKC